MEGVLSYLKSTTCYPCKPSKDHNLETITRICKPSKDQDFHKNIQKMYNKKRLYIKKKSLRITNLL